MVQPRLRLDPCHKTGRLSQAFSWAFSSINRVRRCFYDTFRARLQTSLTRRYNFISGLRAQGSELRAQSSGLNFIAFVEKLNRYQLTHI